MTKQVGLMQQHILNKTLTVTRGGTRKPTQDRVTEATNETFPLKCLSQNVKNIARYHLKCK